MITCDACQQTIQDGESVFTPSVGTSFPTTNDTPISGQFHLQCAKDNGLVTDPVVLEIVDNLINGPVDEPVIVSPPEDEPVAE